MEAKKPRTKEAKVVLNEKFDNKELVKFSFNAKAPYNKEGEVVVISGEHANIFLEQGYGVVCND
jgi:NMD protein affecting ribosome stability and mRNA decay